LNRAEILDEITKTLVEVFQLDPKIVTPEARLVEDLDLDSIDAIDLIVHLKEITGKKVPPDKFKSVRTVGDVVKVLESL